MKTILTLSRSLITAANAVADKAAALHVRNLGRAVDRASRAADKAEAAEYAARVALCNAMNTADAANSHADLVLDAAQAEALSLGFSL